MKYLLVLLTAALWKSGGRMTSSFGGRIDCAEEIIKLTGTDQKIIFNPLPVDDPKQRQPNTDKAREILGWEAKVSRAEGLKITYEYFKALPREVLYQRDHKNFDQYIR